MFEQIEQSLSAECSPMNSPLKAASLDFNCLFAQHLEKFQPCLSPNNEHADETSTLASSNFCSSSFENFEKPLSRKRLSSEDFSSAVFDDIYSRALNFLDSENLEFTAYAPFQTFRTLKPCLKFDRLSLSSPCSDASSSEGDNTPKESFGEKEVQKVAMPSFFARRAASQGLNQTLKIGTPTGNLEVMSRSTPCFVQRNPNLKIVLLSE